MENEMTTEQMKEFEDMVANQKPVGIAMQLRKDGLEFIISHLRILDVVRYCKEQGIEVVGEDSSIGKFQARVIKNDGSSELIELREDI